MSAFAALREGYRAKDGSLEMTHPGGAPWWEAPVPFRFHRCTVQTEAWVDYVNLVERCACGAIRLDGKRGRWMQRNTRKRKP